MRTYYNVKSNLVTSDVIEFLQGKKTGDVGLCESTTEFEKAIGCVPDDKIESLIDRYFSRYVHYVDRDVFVSILTEKKNKTNFIIADSLMFDNANGIDNFISILKDNKLIDRVYSTFYSKLDNKHNIAIMGSVISEWILLLKKIHVSSDENLTTNYCFNFSINKKRINRYILLKLIEHFDIIKHCNYTWSGIGSQFNLQMLLNEIDTIPLPPWEDEFVSNLLSPIQIPVKWISTDRDSFTDSFVKTNADLAWNLGIGDLYCNSAVSLITESIDFEPGIGFTEKSIFSVLGLSLPIWIGGKYQAEQFKTYGFDVFDDVIDHSYQYKNTLIERCYYAIHDNLKLLTDLEFATAIREKVKSRLIANRQMFFDLSKEENFVKTILKRIDDFNISDQEKNLIKVSFVSKLDLINQNQFSN
jgi:hypothetical protein